MKEKKWKRKCPNPDRNPNCKNTLTYKDKYGMEKCIKMNTVCPFCANRGKNNPMYGKTGKNNPMYGKFGKENPRYGKSNYDIWLKKYGKEKADKRQIKINKRMSENHADFCGENNPMYGRSVYDMWLEKYGKEEADKKREEKNKKIRLSALKRNGITFPNYNPVGCEIINGYNMYYGFNFQHAENGGERCIDGYFPDGVDEEQKTIIEIDEKHHFNSNGKLGQKDIRRQRYLEGLGYKFIRVKI